MIIGIVGKLGVGKDYYSNNVIEKILNKYNERYIQMAFADQIKINVMSKKNIEYDDVYVKKTIESRILLQTEGTKERDISKDIWITYLDNWRKIHYNRGINNFVITDCRFINEMEYIKKSGGIIIKIIAPKRNYQKLLQESLGDLDMIENIRNHKSECDLDNIMDKNFDLVIDNDIEYSIEELQLQFTKMYFRSVGRFPSRFLM